MSFKFQSFLSFLRNQEIKTLNLKFKEVIDTYAFTEISEKNFSEINLRFSQNIKESNVIIISHFKKQETGKLYHYFVLSFKRTILVINEKRFKIL